MNINNIIVSRANALMIQLQISHKSDSKGSSNSSNLMPLCRIMSPANGPISTNYLSMFNPISTRGVPGINARKVRRLNAASFQIAVAQYAVAVRPRDLLSSPSSHCRVAVPQPRLAPSQKLVRQFEVEIVSNRTLRIS